MYHHTQVGWLTIWIAGTGMVLAWTLAILLPEGGTAFWLVSVGMAVVLAGFGWLTVSVAGGELKVRFGIGVFRKRYRLSTIRAAEPVRNRWYWGWGIRYTPEGWLYNVSGLHAVEVVFGDGSKVRIGSDDPSGLAEAVREAAGP